jgi:pimeloyl-ACP methyl ester carboxylesterase
MAEKYARVSDAITLAWDERGDPGGTPLLMVHGLGTQMIAWRPEFLDLLAERGLRVIIFDNRDAGLSTHLDGMPDIRAMLGGDMSSAPYSLREMAADTRGLLDQLELDSVHVLGVSMGGMIAQTLAAEHPERVRSLTSIMSTTGERAVSESTPEAQATLLAPRPTTPDEAAERAIAGARVIGSPGMLDEDWIRTLARRSFERAYDPPGFARQMAAIWSAGNRTDAVRTITAPTLVIHGERDPLIPMTGGKATAAAIDGAELIVIEGMGHDMPRPLWPRIVDAVAAHVERAEAASAERAA